MAHPQKHPPHFCYIVCDPSHSLLPCAPPCPPLTAFHCPEEAQCLFDALYLPQAPTTVPTPVHPPSECILCARATWSFPSSYPYHQPTRQAQLYGLQLSLMWGQVLNKLIHNEGRHLISPFTLHAFPIGENPGWMERDFWWASSLPWKGGSRLGARAVSRAWESPHTLTIVSSREI